MGVSPGLSVAVFDVRALAPFFQARSSSTPAAQWNGFGSAIRTPEPNSLTVSLEGVSGFGKVKAETTEAVSEPIPEGQDLNLTVSRTGTKQAERESEGAQVVHVIGRGERI